MTKQIRNLGLFFVALYMALFVRVNWVTVFDAENLQENPHNNRAIRRDFDAPRGSITTADGVVLAESIETEPGSRFDYQRVFPEQALYAHITGYYGFSVGAASLEESYHKELVGDTNEFELQDIGELFVERERVGNLTLSVRDDVQRVAQQALGNNEGSVVALDPRTGAVLALWSNPSYDPNLLSTHDLDAAAAANSELNANEENPKLSRAYDEIFFPGSTFKVVTAAAGIEHAGVNANDPEYPVMDSYTATEGGRPLRNFGDPPNRCGGDLFEILQASCNSAFAIMGVEQVGGEGMIETAQSFGFNDDEMPFDLDDPATSTFPTSIENQQTGEQTSLDQNPGILAQMSIGQNGVAASPLHMALIAAGIANDGVIMEPYVVQQVRDGQDEVIHETEPEEWRQATSPSAAATLRDGMETVVSDGSARHLGDGLEAYTVGGKTGTAQLGTDPPSSHAWIIGFAGPEGRPPEVAVAVIVEGRPGVSETTGGTVAAPIANQVLREVLEPGSVIAPRGGAEGNTGGGAGGED